ncbi:unnamed protein product [Amoebophrya sp. A25]|nr:unnamed protein product [Amoebophrya sp. A25]|eukprot:GSA25T00025392001.1
MSLLLSLLPCCCFRPRNSSTIAKMVSLQTIATMRPAHFPKRRESCFTSLLVLFFSTIAPLCLTTLPVSARIQLASASPVTQMRMVDSTPVVSVEPKRRLRSSEMRIILAVYFMHDTYNGEASLPEKECFVCMVNPVSCRSASSVPPSSSSCDNSNTQDGQSKSKKRPTSTCSTSMCSNNAAPVESDSESGLTRQKRGSSSGSSCRRADAPASSGNFDTEEPSGSTAQLECSGGGGGAAAAAAAAAAASQAEEPSSSAGPQPQSADTSREHPLPTVPDVSVPDVSTFDEPNRAEPPSDGICLLSCGHTVCRTCGETQRQQSRGVQCYACRPNVPAVESDRDYRMLLGETFLTKHHQRHGRGGHQHSSRGDRTHRNSQSSRRLNRCEVADARADKCRCRDELCPWQLCFSRPLSVHEHLEPILRLFIQDGDQEHARKPDGGETSEKSREASRSPDSSGSAEVLMTSDRRSVLWRRAWAYVARERRLFDWVTVEGRDPSEFRDENFRSFLCGDHYRAGESDENSCLSQCCWRFSSMFSDQDHALSSDSTTPATRGAGSSSPTANTQGRQQVGRSARPQVLQARSVVAFLQFRAVVDLLDTLGFAGLCAALREDVLNGDRIYTLDHFWRAANSASMPFRDHEFLHRQRGQSSIFDAADIEGGSRRRNPTMLTRQNRLHRLLAHRATSSEQTPRDATVEQPRGLSAAWRAFFLLDDRTGSPSHPQAPLYHELSSRARTTSSGTRRDGTIHPGRGRDTSRGRRHHAGGGSSATIRHSAWGPVNTDSSTLDSSATTSTVQTPWHSCVDDLQSTLESAARCCCCLDASENFSHAWRRRKDCIGQSCLDFGAAVGSCSQYSIEKLLPALIVVAMDAGCVNLFISATELFCGIPDWLSRVCLFTCCNGFPTGCYCCCLRPFVMMPARGPSADWIEGRSGGVSFWETVFVEPWCILAECPLSCCFLTAEQFRDRESLLRRGARSTAAFAGRHCCCCCCFRDLDKQSDNENDVEAADDGDAGEESRCCGTCHCWCLAACWRRGLECPCIKQRIQYHRILRVDEIWPPKASSRSPDAILRDAGEDNENGNGNASGGTKTNEKNKQRRNVEPQEGAEYDEEIGAGCCFTHPGNDSKKNHDEDDSKLDQEDDPALLSLMEAFADCRLSGHPELLTREISRRTLPRGVARFILEGSTAAKHFLQNVHTALRCRAALH